MPAAERNSRLTEEQKQSVVCPLCFAGVGKPCKLRTVHRDQAHRTMGKAHEARKLRAQYKIALDKTKASIAQR